MGDIRLLNGAKLDELKFEIVGGMAEGNKKFAFDEKRTNRLLVVSELDADFLGGDVFLLNVKVSPIGFIKLFFTCYS